MTIGRALSDLNNLLKADDIPCYYKPSMIDESIQSLIAMKSVIGVNQLTINEVIETMRKYQKMQEILEKVWNIPSCMIDKAECLDRIMETYRTVR